MLKGQLEIEFNKYHNLYSLIIPKENILKQINDLVDFSFVYDELMVSEPKENNQVKRIDIGLFLLDYENKKHDISKNMDISRFFCSNHISTEKITIFSVASLIVNSFYYFNCLP